MASFAQTHTYLKAQKTAQKPCIFNGPWAQKPDNIVLGTCWDRLGVSTPYSQSAVKICSGQCKL